MRAEGSKRPYRCVSFSHAGAIAMRAEGSKRPYRRVSFSTRELSR